MLLGGDFIRLRHSEIQGDLSAEYTSDHFNSVFIRKYNGKYSLE